jgi:hypothetical protein
MVDYSMHNDVLLISPVMYDEFDVSVDCEWAGNIIQLSIDFFDFFEWQHCYNRKYTD